MGSVGRLVRKKGEEREGKVGEGKEGKDET